MCPSPKISVVTIQFLVSLFFPVGIALILAFFKGYFLIKSLFRLNSIHRRILIQNSNRIDRLERFLQSGYRYDPGTSEPIIDELDL